MKGADKYCKVFKRTQQVGRLYLVVSAHARGDTFRVYVLPEGEDAKPNGSCNPPLNKDAVEVYGAVSGQLGWTETYDWKHHGKWEEDLNALYKERKDQLEKETLECRSIADSKEAWEEDNVRRLLGTY